ELVGLVGTQRPPRTPVAFAPRAAKAAVQTGGTAVRRGVETSADRARVDPPDDLPALSADPQLGRPDAAAQGFIDGLVHRHVHRHPVAFLDLDQHVEGRWGLALE